MAKKKGGPNQFEERTGIKGVTAVEAMACDPFAMAIVAPEPPRDIMINVELGDLSYNFGYVDIVGPNDSFERGLGWDGTFRWAQQSDRAREQLLDHVINNLAGHRQKPIVCHHEKDQEFPTVVEGRHSVLSERIANLIRVRQHKEPIRVAFRRRRYDTAAAAIAAEVGNLSYERDPLDVIEQRLYLISENGWDDAAAARHFKKSEATIRAWRHRANGSPKRERSPDAPRPLRRAEVGAAFERARKSKADGADLVAMVLEVVKTGQIPADAPRVLRIVFEEK
jgi:hypothetical protein